MADLFYFCLHCSRFFRDKEGTREKRVLSPEEDAQIPVPVIICAECNRKKNKQQQEQAATL